MNTNTGYGKIKLLLCIRQGQIGGGESHVLSLVENLDKETFDPVVLSFTDGPMIESLNQMKIKSYVVYTEKPFDFFVLNKVKKILEKEKIEIVHAHGSRACTNILLVARLLNLPIIYTVHGWSFHEDQSFLTRKLRVFVEGLLTKKVDHTISVSETNKLSGSFYIKNLNSVVINNGIDLKKFNPERKLKDIREEFNIPESVTLVGCIFRMTKQKDPLNMIKAFHLALQESQDIRLLMIGEGEMKKEVMDKVKELEIENFVYFDNFRQDVPDILKSIDIFCLPSLWEGLPIGLLEAMAMGKAVVATNVDGSKEVVRHNVNGLLVEPADSRSLAEAILKIHHELSFRSEIQINARETAFKKFDVLNMVRETEKIYLRC